MAKKYKQRLRRHVTTYGYKLGKDQGKISECFFSEESKRCANVRNRKCTVKKMKFSKNVAITKHCCLAKTQVDCNSKTHAVHFPMIWGPILYYHCEYSHHWIKEQSAFRNLDRRVRSCMEIICQNPIYNLKCFLKTLVFPFISILYVLLLRQGKSIYHTKGLF